MTQPIYPTTIDGADCPVKWLVSAPACPSWATCTNCSQLPFAMSGFGCAGGNGSAPVVFDYDRPASRFTTVLHHFVLRRLVTFRLATFCSISFCSSNSYRVFGRLIAWCVLCAIAPASCLVAADVSPAEADADTPTGETTASESLAVSYAADIEPIFRRNCFGCHQGAKQLGSYQMTSFESLLAGGESGEAAVVPGKSKQSYLISQIDLVDGAAEMPKSPAKPLTEIEIDLIKRWIDEGAVNDISEDVAPLYSAESPPEYEASPAATSVDVSPDGTRIAVAGYHEVVLVDVESKQVSKRLVGMSRRLNTVRFSPDGKLLAAVGGTPGIRGEVQIWDASSGDLALSKVFTYDTLAGLAWSPDSSKLAFGATDNVVRAINASDGEQILFQGAHDDWVQDVAFTPDGKHLVSVARDMSCKLTEVETERFVDNITSITPGALSGGLSSVAMHPQRNEILIGGADGIAKVYRIFRETARKIGDDANLIRKLPAIPGRIFSVAISPDGSRLAAASTLNGKSEVRVWSYNFSGTLTDEAKKILAKRVADRSAKEKELVKAQRDVKTEQLAQLELPSAACYAIEFTPDNRLVVAADDGNLRIIPSDGEPAEQIALVPSRELAEKDDQLSQRKPGNETAGRSRTTVSGFDATAYVTSQHQSVDRSTTIDVASVLDVTSIKSIRIHPESISVHSPYEYCQLVVTGTKRNGETIDVTHQCNIQPSALVVVSPSRVIRPIADGTGSLVVSLGEHKAVMKWHAEGVRASANDSSSGSVDFIRDVNPVLSRLGCNQGTCHGAQKGKNGFKLSLRGYDPVYDLRALTDDLAARRINAAAPQQSLMLQKPLGKTPHEGGVLMNEGDPYHAVLKRWIADGCELDLDVERVERLEFFPQNPIVQSIGDTQQIRLIAHYADGSSRDVTQEAFVDSGNTEVASSGKGGLLTAMRRGEAAILARYEGSYAATTLTVMGKREGYQPGEFDAWSPIDSLVEQKWRRVKVAPSDLCDDASFLRRVTLDLTGMPPTSDEIREFLADGTPTKQKRDRVIDRLLASESYVDFWTNKWADLLQVNRKFLGVEGSTAFREWIRESVADNQPYDQFAREILTATGSNKENPPASYFKVLRVPEDTMENTTHLFLGIRFNCNKCHDHPFERWTQNQYYEMAAFFGRTALENDPASGGKKIGGTAVEGAKPLYEKVVDRKSGDVKHVGTGAVVAPAFPYEVDHESGKDATRRQQLAAWMTDADNPYFARSFVNRLWGYLLGVGLIEPIDDIRAGNPPTNPELLDHLTQQFVASGFDRREMLRQICRSRTYQLSVETNPLNNDDMLNYSHAMPRRLPAEVIYDAVHSLTGTVSNIPGMPKGTRAAAVTDSGVKLTDGFLQNLGRPVRESACECERSSELQLGPIMALVVGPTISGAISDPTNELERIVNENPDDRELANEIFLRSLGRLPTESEFAAFDQIKQQIKLDHEQIEQQVAKGESSWKHRKAELEKTRLQKLADVKTQLAAQVKASQPEQDRKKAEREKQIAAATKTLESAKGGLSKKVTDLASKNIAGTEWHPLLATKVSSTNKANLVNRADRSILVSGAKTKTVYNIQYKTSVQGITGFRLETLADESLPSSGPGLPKNGNFVITEIDLKVASAKDPAGLNDVKIESALADYTQDGFNIKQTFDASKRDQRGWAVSPVTGVDHWATFKLKEPINNPDGSILSFQLHQFHNAVDHRLGRFRISITTAKGKIPLGLSDSLQAIVSTPAKNRSEQEAQQLLAFVGRSDPAMKKAKAALAKANQAVPRDKEVVRLEKERDRLSVVTPDDPQLVQLRSDFKFSTEQLANLRLTAAEDLTWALINSPAFLFNH